METSLTGLRRLLAVELPLDAVGPSQRDAVRRALRAGDAARLRAMARAVVGELLRSGRLLRVAVEGGNGLPGGPFALVPGSSRLIDLGCLGTETPWAEAPLPSLALPGPERLPDLSEVSDLLEAMEFAQDLEVADLRTADKGSILAGVLRLVGRFVPQFDLHLQLPSGEMAPDGGGQVFTLDAAGRAEGWQPLRPTGHSVWIPSADELPAMVRQQYESHRGQPAGCGVAVPLWEPPRTSEPGDHAVEAGLLYLTAGGEWGREPLLRLAERLSRFVTRRWQSQREVNLRIHKDGLTGVFNRAYFDSQFPLELERARRSQGPLTLVLADLDHFKIVNDRYGHPAGDRVLKMVARRLQEALRRIDHVCRVGGEEFALILTDTPAEAAHEVVGRLLDAEYRESVDEDGHTRQIPVTLSAGAVTFPGAGLDPFELYRKADAMLYLSKDLGRDQCHFWDSEGQHLRLTPPTAVTGRAPRSVTFLRNWWPLLWAGLHLGGVVAGGAVPAQVPALFTEAAPGWGRILALTPLLAWGTGAPGAVVAGAATIVGSGAWGWAEAGARRRRADAVAPDPWGRAIPVRAEGRGLLRITGWSAPASGGRWRVPARFLEFVPAALPGAPVAVPRPGDGIMLTGSGPPPAIGMMFASQLTVARPRGAGVPDAFDYRRHLAGRGLTWTGRADKGRVVEPASADPAARLGVHVLAPLQRVLVGALERLLPPREAALAASVLLGTRDAESRRNSQTFTDLGLAHLFAVSGLHVGILLALVLAPARAIGFGPLLSALPVLVLLPPYAVLTGLPGSVIRAAGVAALALVAPLLGRRLDTLRALGLVYAASVVWDPRIALDVGLRLSYLAAGGILGISRVTGGLKFFRPRALVWLGSGLGVTLAAQWFTLPVAAQAFGRISLLAPLANLLVVPAFGIGVWLTVMALALDAVFRPAGEACGALAWLVFRFLAAGVAWAAAGAGEWELGLPALSAGRFVAWLLLSALLLGWLARMNRAGQRRRALALLTASAPVGLLLATLPPQLSRPTREIVLVQFDVGQGDCGLLTFPDGWRVLLDTGGTYGFGETTDGPFARDVLPCLRRVGVRSVDAAVLTHGHRDHTGGTRVAADKLEVGRWYCGGRAVEALEGLPDTARVQAPVSVRELHRWREWEVSLLDVPVEEADGLAENDRSLVLVVRQGGQGRLVWSGDLEKDGEARLLAAHPGLGQTEVWKAGHHGSDTSGSGAWLERLHPRLVLISCGVGNRYRHPSHGPYVVHGDTVPTLRSDIGGSATVRWEAGTGRLRVHGVWPSPGHGCFP